MSLTSALNTALTGMSAAETMIDVDGNNIANSNTVGFKASAATFATQFLQTQGLGSSPTTTNGGTNPRQIGMGTMVAGITPNFTQGTVEISSNSTDMAIQGDGFFIVQGQNGTQEYTRNGVFKLNANNELITSTGNRLLGYGIDSNYQIQSTQLQPISIPLGTIAVAKATDNVELQGSLTSSGLLATSARVIQSGVLGDASIARPVIDPAHVPPVPTKDFSIQETLGALTPAAGGTLTTGTTYNYRVTFSNVQPSDPTFDQSYSEGSPTTIRSYTIQNDGNNTIQIPAGAVPNPLGYTYVNIYRSTGNSTDYQLLASQTAASAAMNPFVDDGTVMPTPPSLNPTTLTNTYNYYIAYADPNGVITRPSDQITGVTVTAGRVHLTNLPAPLAGDTHQPPWSEYVIYRNYGTSGSNYVETGRIPITPTAEFTDSTSDDVLQTKWNNPINRLNFNGPPASESTRLVDLIRQTTGTTYEFMFPSAGTMDFFGTKGGSKLATKELTVTGNWLTPPQPADSRVIDLLNFMTEALGIQTRDATNGIPPSRDIARQIDVDPGASIGGGVISIVGNNGTANAVDISLDGMQFTSSTGQVSTVDMPFTKYQDAIGESTSTDMIVYDSLGTPCNLRITADKESSSGTGTVYRWFADSPANILPDPNNPSISVGTGTITFDSSGKFVSASNDKVTIYRNGTPAISPLVFTLNFNNISGLAEATSTLQMKTQNGSAPGKLASFIVGEDGLITGVFSNSIKRNLGQIRLARFSNPAGLEQKGQNLYASGVNSGVPIEGNPGQQGIGSIVAGAVELSNTDIGGSLTDLILASTMYRGNARVITTTQQLFDELLALKR